MRLILTWSGLSVCLSVDTPAPCKSRCTDRDSVWGGNSCWPKDHYVRRGSDFRHRFDAAFAKLLWPFVEAELRRKQRWLTFSFLGHDTLCNETTKWANANYIVLVTIRDVVTGNVGWVIWPVKYVPEMTYKVSSGTLNLCSLTHWK